MFKSIFEITVACIIADVIMHDVHGNDSVTRKCARKTIDGVYSTVDSVGKGVEYLCGEAVIITAQLRAAAVRRGVA